MINYTVPQNPPSHRVYNKVQIIYHLYGNNSLTFSYWTHHHCHHFTVITRIFAYFIMILNHRQVYALVLILHLFPATLSCQSCFHPKAFHPIRLDRHSHQGILQPSDHGGSSRLLTESMTRAVAVAFARQRITFNNNSPRHLVSQLIRKLKYHLSKPSSFQSKVIRSTTYIGLALGTIAITRQIMVRYAKSQQLVARPLGMFSGDGEVFEKKGDGGADEGLTGKEDPSEEQAQKEKEKVVETPLSTAMVATIGVYKNFISPLLPPACRFVPTCSQYGVQAIKEFGPCKGVILTSWRILRCSPVGGKGYDPPKWPPVPYTYSSY